MSNKWILALLISASLATGAGVFVAMNHRPQPPAASVDEVTQSMTLQIQQFTQAVVEGMEKTQREVKRLHGTVTQETATMRPDDVADGLNAELARFRELSLRTGGVADPGAGLLD